MSLDAYIFWIPITVPIRFYKIKFPESLNPGMVMNLFKGTILDFEVTNVTIMFPYFALT